MRKINMNDEASANRWPRGRRSSLLGGVSFLNLFLISLMIMLLWAVPAFAVDGTTGGTGDVSPSGETLTGDSTPGATAAEAVTPEAAADEAVTSETGTNTSDAAAAVETDAAAETAAAPDDEAIADEEQPATDEVADDTATTAVGDPEEEPCDCDDGTTATLEALCENIDEYLELICGDGEWGVYWESTADYEAGLLSIQYRLTNTSDDTSVNNIRVSGATATNGVKIHNELPLPLGSLEPGEWLYFVLKWEVPKQVGNFVTDITICADCDREELCEGPECEPVPVCEGDACNPPIDEEQQPPVDPGLNTLHASTLPNTGFDLGLALVLGLCLVTLGALVPVARKARQWRR